MGVPEGRPSRGIDERIVGGRVGWSNGEVEHGGAGKGEVEWAGACVYAIFAFFFAFRLVSAAFCSALSARGAMSEVSEFLNRSLFSVRFLQANSQVCENKNAILSWRTSLPWHSFGLSVHG